MNEKMLDVVQDCNLNFLLGSGLSCPYLKTLGSIERLLTNLDDSRLPQDQEKIIRCSLYKKYFESVISRNCKILTGDPEASTVLNAYSDFLRTINLLLLKRKSTILGKEVNIFTTNIDIFLETALEDNGLQCNDGFNGRFKPSFSSGNFKKSHFKKSLHYDNISEIPTFNLIKLHGSLTWQLDGGGIVFSRDLTEVVNIQSKLAAAADLLDVGEDANIDSLVAACGNRVANPSTGTFIEAYERLLIVNPTKAKIKDSLLNETYYELFRIYSNELEKENTVLFAMGFSFADEHIRTMTLRAANTNPTLIIYVIAHNGSSRNELEKLGLTDVKHRNIEIIAPPIKDNKDVFEYDLPTINREVFRKLSNDRRFDSAAAAPSSA